MTKSFKCLLIVFLAMLILSCSKPVPTNYDSSEINPSEEPAQENIEGEKPIIIEKKGWTFSITPKAKYKISGEVLSAKRYYYGLNA
ncbi:MAG: hypothetical protein N2445_03035, partial [Acidobacteria bacterium]|nr:hypothetical protein [Acidobacteriota bacterium]